MPLSAKKFNAELEGLKKLPVDQMIKFQKVIALEALRRIVLKTPVDTGRARGNWQTTINRLPPSEPIEPVDPITAGLPEISKLTDLGVIFIANNLPYIERLESGYSKQAPNGMVALTLEELRVAFP
jgi:hypothetical protein